ncbi:hypothetical protein ACFV0O_16465 [Kitasatospora sp. NPDC059577]|uniref:hypothetical protein n=1 Tax=unclassified Kitasatospora TaxID=2633591 RepID=UPI00367DB914
MAAGPLALALAVLSLAVPAAPAAADEGGGVPPARGWGVTAAALCLQEVAVVPVLGGSLGDHVDDCGRGNAVDHALG